MKIQSVDLSKVMVMVPDTEYKIVDVTRNSRIDKFVEKVTDAPYIKGSTFYQLTKKETVQPSKQIYIRDKSTGCVYQGDNARTLLGIPKNKCQICPEFNIKFDIFIQSTSLNRLLVSGSKVLIIGF